MLGALESRKKKWLNLLTSCRSLESNNSSPRRLARLSHLIIFQCYIQNIFQIDSFSFLASAAVLVQVLIVLPELPP